jgi:hypothetical protein
MRMASHLINYDLPWSAGRADQINGRHQRAGSEFSKVFIADLIVSGTLEERKLDMLDYKVDIKSLYKKPRHTSQWNPPTRMWSRIYRGYYEADVEFTFDMTQATYQVEYLAFRQRRRRLIRIWQRGPALGVSGGTTYYQGYTLDLVVEWLDVPERDFSNGKDSVELKLKGKIFYDPSIGYTHKFTWYSRLPGW